MSPVKTKSFVCLVLGLATVIFLTPAIAQSIFGTILGTVTDPSGAVMPGVTVTVTNQGENISRDVKTDEQGNYRAENMKAGIYTVAVKAQGFKEAVLTDIRLDARQIVREDISLTMGQTQEKVTVEAAPELINTESQEIATSITGKEVLDLPANYRGNRSTSPYNILAFLPGVTGDADGNISVQGTGLNEVEYSLDGISTTNIRSSGPQQELFPSAEIIAEMKVQGSGGGAQYGNPADITTTSKSGTNTLHGSAFEYFQNAALDATRFVDPLPLVPKAAKSANTFGGSIGGPIFKNRTFFFGDYEGMRYRSQTLRQETVPNQAMRNGDFSQFCDHYDVNQICDSTNPDASLQIHDLDGTPFPGNIIPADKIDPRAPAILQFYPLPLQGGPDNFAHFNHTLNLPNPILSDQFDIRIDHNINSTQSVFGRWTYNNRRLVSPSALGLPAEQDFEHYNQIVLAHNYAITPNLINELRGGISRRQNGGNFPLDGPAFMQQLGLNSNQLGPFPPGGFPDFIFEPRGGIDAIVHTRPNPELSNNFQINENLTWTKGRHTMKFGFDVRFLHLVTAWYSGGSAADDYGDFFFNGQYSGDVFADFLLGVPYYTYVTHTPPRNIDGKATHYYAYATDSFRATKKLTIDVGLRISRIPPLYDPINLTNFDPSVPDTGRVIISSDPRSLAATQPLWAQAINACDSPNQIPNYAGPDPSFPCTPFLTSKQAGWPKQLRNVYTNFAPRFGFAYRPFADNKTVIRGGAGVYDVTTLGAVFFSVAGIHDGFQANYSNVGFGDAGFFRFPDVQDPSLVLLGTQSFFTANQKDKKDPYSIQWNLSVERELFSNTALRVSYIANKGNQLTWAPDLNQAPIIDGTPGPKPFPAWARVRSRSGGAISTYESMQAELIHKYSKGITFQSTYTWAKNLSDTESWPRSRFSGEVTGDTMNRFNLRGDYGNVGGTRKHRWITTLVDELPVGKGRWLLGNANGALNAIVGGWRLSTILLVQSGPYDTPFLQFDSSGNAIFGFNRPDLAGNPNDIHHTRNQWWNANVFACPGGAPGENLVDNTLACTDANVIGRFGNAGVGSLVGPGTFNLSMGLAKDFRLTERVRLKFETSFTNLPNHPNFDDPRNNLSESVNGQGTFGQVQAARAGDAGGNRVGQFALRIDF